MNANIKRSINKAIFHYAPALKINSFFSARFSGIGSIFFFHRICSIDSPDRLDSVRWLECPEDSLEKLIKFLLKSKYNIISLNQLYDALRNGRNPGKFVVLTFDDGYADNFENAYPIFKKYNVPFTIYISTSFPEKTAVFWWYVVEDILLKNDAVSFVYKSQKHELDTSTKELKEKAYNYISDLFFDADNKWQHELLNSICEPYGADIKSYSEGLPLSWEQIETLAKDDLVTIGAHTHNHYPLSSLTYEDAYNEILKSKEMIEEHIGRKVEHFAYPFGKIEHSAKREFEIVKKIGFKTASTTRIANIFPDHGAHTEALPRNMIFGDLEIVSQAKVYLSGMTSALKYKFRQVITE